MSNNGTGEIHMGESDSALREMRNNQRQNAQIHLIHDFGMSAAKFIGQHYSAHEIQKGILMQRAEMTVAGTLCDADDKLIGKIDLAKLGITPEHIAQVEVLKAADASKVLGAHTTAAVGEAAISTVGRGYGGKI